MLCEIITDKHYPGLNPVQVGEERCAPGHSFGPAVRTHWLLHYVVSGCGQFVRGGVTYCINPGDTFVIRPYEETYYEADRENPWYYIWLGFTADTLPCPLESAVLHMPALGEIFADARRYGELNDGKSAFLAGKLWELFACLLNQGARRQDYVDQALHCMKLEYANGITVSEIARRLNLNRSYFSTLFKEKTGFSPQAWLNKLRLEKAADLMLRFRTSPSVAAASTGYSDVYQFSRMFKQYYSVSPREYIRRHSDP